MIASILVAAKSLPMPRRGMVAIGTLGYARRVPILTEGIRGAVLLRAKQMIREGACFVKGDAPRAHIPYRP